ncbi:MAG: NADP oxidoreductase [Thiohalocapsa sp.]|jgi:NAD-reducing hydrogenase small subunit|uniref:NADH-quinone oxidoreductase subunit B family protein n=1 Tax=Thiohalocapsa sp. TaxID=2497641 RepID=UPI0025EBBDB1|nr:NADP oxidoreductase [Thiohalocapsa sp.]MCG6940420.1 NADP oxidoreductase [Thiohalocapsa sp.]
MNAPAPRSPWDRPGAKLRVATASLAGCFGCHMSLLDLDERFLDLVELVALDRTPLTDIKHLGPCDIGLIEGGAANAENVEVLREFRRNCRVLVAVGACAITGGIPAMRNNVPLAECLHEAFVRGQGLVDRGIPDDPELPLLLSQVHPIHEVVRVDHFLPGCPPSADAIWSLLTAVLEGRAVVLPWEQLHYD